MPGRLESYFKTLHVAALFEENKNKQKPKYPGVCMCCSANAVSSRDGLDTETGTESLLSHRRERERERARRRARETEREYYQTDAD